MCDTLYAILNKNENATLQYFIFCEKVLDEKYLLKINNVSRHPASDSSKHHQFVSFDVQVMFLFVFKALFTEFCNCACAIKIVIFTRVRHSCVALIHKKAVLSLETSSEINFEVIKFVKNL